MYFDFEDLRPDTPRVGPVISWREGVLLSIIVHMAGIIGLLLAPNLLKVDPVAAEAARARAVALSQQKLEDQARFVFVQPRVERPVPKAPERAEPSDVDRVARAPQRAPNPANALPFARGNTPERVEEVPSRARGEGPGAEPAAGPPQPSATPAPPQPEQRTADASNGLQVPTMSVRPQPSASGSNGRATVGGGALGDAVKNLQRYVQMFDNQRGGGGEFGPEIQFDTKGVEFGPWIRRFIAQVKRNWNVPYAAMSLKGHVVITFNVHKDGAITDVTVAGPSGVESFNSAAFGALSGSNPTQPLPAEYPSEKAFFTVTFFYNETPP